MTTRVRLARQVVDFVETLAPEPRRALRLGIKNLPKGNVRMLEGKLSQFARLRVRGFRVVYRERRERGERVFDCIFAERRSVVYDLFEQLAVDDFLEELGQS